MATYIPRHISGILAVILQELDPLTDLPLEGGVECLIECPESITCEPNLQEGTTITKICGDNRIDAIRRLPDAVIDYTATLTGGGLTPCALDLISGANLVYSLDAEGAPTENVQWVNVPLLEEGLQFRPFRMFVFCGTYLGDAMRGQTVLIFNRCKGALPSIDVGNDDFYAPEWDITAMEASIAGLSMLTIGYYRSQEAPTSLPDELNIVGVATTDPDITTPEGASAFGVAPLSNGVQTVQVKTSNPITNETVANAKVNETAALQGTKVTKKK